MDMFHPLRCLAPWTSILSPHHSLRLHLLQSGPSLGFHLSLQPLIVRQVLLQLLRINGQELRENPGRGMWGGWARPNASLLLGPYSQRYPGVSLPKKLGT